MQTTYLTPDNIKVYPAVNSPNDGNINTEYNTKTLAKSSTSRNYILSGFNFISSSSQNKFKLGVNTEDSCVRGSCMIDGYYVEIYDNIEFEYTPQSGAVVVFAIPHYASNTYQDPTQIQIEKSQHLTGVEGEDFIGIRFECLDAKYIPNSDNDIIFNPTEYTYSDDSENHLPSNALLIGIIGYSSTIHQYVTNLINQYATWEYSKINAEDVALPDIDDSYGEHLNSSLIPLQTSTINV